MVEHLRRVIRNEAPAVSNRPLVLPRGQLAQLVEYINENLGSDLSIAVLAGIAKMSVSYFARCFKGTMGTTPHGYLVQRRVERAKSLPADGDLPIAEVALECGFATQAHLTTVFRNAVGATPNSYRRSLAWPFRKGAGIGKKLSRNLEDCLADSLLHWHKSVQEGCQRALHMDEAWMKRGRPV